MTKHDSPPSAAGAGAAPPPGEPAAGSHAADRPADRAADRADRQPLRRSKRDKVLAGVCGGLGRYFDLDPAIFRIVLGVLAVTGGVGLIFYGFAWLLLPVEGEDDSEAKKLLTGRVEGATLAAVFAALVGCALFLSMLDNGGLAVFSVLVILALGGASYWSQRRRAAAAPEAEPQAAHRPAPPETQAPPVPGAPSWWRGPLVKDGTTGPVGSTGYLWGPDDSAEAGAVPDTAGGKAAVAPERAAAPKVPRGGIGGRVFVLALLAGGAATASVWQGSTLSHALQIGLASALAVFGLGLAVSSVKGRTGFGTVLLAMITAGLLAGASALPREIGTDWKAVAWRPAAVADVKPLYTAGTGLATLDLSRLDVPKGTTLSVRATAEAGRLKVIVPREVTAQADVSVKLGDIRLPGDTSQEVRIKSGGETQRATLEPPAGTEAGGTIELHLNAGVGQVEVARAAS
ncbi:PspC domain-containing protein [Streptomyces sp. NBC_01443]|uniref:PspC domain-containing protein n=1 Tax=Streptomyces sp. NBC_01443 TaxID=2903868 RepID=UPI002259AED1|nr:PspC domain-containing protein [Streptomyces sp. NBC_01443]MCX4628063.1 PspC domain-containing protein [Streptomyces sp. NBC_01443]